MTFSSEWRDSFFDGYEHRRSAGNALPQRILAAGTLVCVTFACAFSLWNNLGGGGAERAEQQAEAVSEAVVSRVVAKGDALRFGVDAAYAKLAAAMKSAAHASSRIDAYTALFDSHSLGYAPGMFTRPAELVAAAALTETQPAAPKSSILAAKSARQDETAAASPVPLRSHAAPLRVAGLPDGADATSSVGDAPAQKPGIFERLFGRPSPLTLAYAAPEDAALGDGGAIAAARYDSDTAVYDISAHTVYLPDGTRLEAHSGLGSRMDDPNHTDERMRGATPTTVYDLRLRESPFHGVQALRLIPLDESKVHGRSGLLAHTFMLGSNGQSNGCVSFKNYSAFLHAYMQNKIKRLAVVARLD